LIEAAFGQGTSIFAQTTERLRRIFAQVGHVPQVSARFREWRRYQSAIHGHEAPGEETFIHQTYLALLARLVARRFVAPRRPFSSDEELLEVINIDYFSRRGIGNFGEGDIFSWIPLEDRWELDLDDLVLETVRGLADDLAPYDLAGALPGILDDLYRQTAPATPRWLAEYIVEDALGLGEDPDLSLVDPACGTGVFLTAAIEAMSRNVADPLDVLFEAPEKIRGMDREPLAVVLARLNYLLALGDLIQEEHPPFLLPVYLADAHSVPVAGQSESGDVIFTLTTTAGDFPLPEPVVRDPMMLDWLLGRLTNYMDGAQLRLRIQPEDVAVQEVLNAYYNYLTAAKPRTPVPDALTPKQADSLLETARLLVQLHIRNEGTLWLHLVQNMAAPTVFSRRGFDRLASHGSPAFFKSCSELYLGAEGRAAMVTPESSPTPDSIQIITGPGQQISLQIEGGPVPSNRSWADAKVSIQVTKDS